MDPTQLSAPPDHSSPERAYLTELSVRLSSLQKALPLAHRVVGGAHHGLISACAAVIAYLPTQPLGLNEGFWSAMTAIAVVQTEFRATETTARDQFIGAAIRRGYRLVRVRHIWPTPAGVCRGRRRRDAGVLGRSTSRAPAAWRELPRPSFCWCPTRARRPVYLGRALRKWPGV